MKKKEEKPEIGYLLKSFQILQFSSTFIPTFNVNDESSFNVGVQYLLPPDLSFIIVRTTIKLLLGAPDNNDEMNAPAQLVTQMQFDTKNLELYAEGLEVNPPKSFMQNIANAAISTSRGIFYAKNFGSQFSHLILPMIDTARLLPTAGLKLPEVFQPTIFEEKKE